MKTLVIRGDATDPFPLADGCVQTVVTSPPYWGLRDYGIDGQLGLEKTPEDYVEKMVRVFREVWRVLRGDGTVWLNMGDSYASGGRDWYDGGDRVNGVARGHHSRPDTPRGLKAKDLVGMPWRLAFALQADGWYLRSDIVWSKSNPMPESVTDRPTKAHEYVFLLTKSARYYYNADAVRSPLAAKTYTTFGTQHREQGNDALGSNKSDNWGRTVSTRKPRLATPKQDSPNGGGPRYIGFNGRWDAAEARGEIAGANLRTVWTIATEGFPEAHFATFPTALVRPCILAGSRPNDFVLDPFAGSGTVGVVSRQHGRRFVGLELSPTYATMAQRRIQQDGRPKETRPLRDPNVHQTGLFE